MDHIPAPNDDSERGINFKLERYKYILQQIHALNENVHKYLNLFQVLTTAILGGGTGLFLSWKSLKITPDIAILGIKGLLGLFTILSAFVIFVIITGIISWIDYRREEVELLNETVYTGFRQPPNIRNFWRWHEPYIILFIIIVVVLIHFFVRTKIIPLIH